MKILAFSDLHRETDAAKSMLAHSHQADILVGAGDFATRGKGTQDTISILKSLNKPIILVGGNHDNSDELAALCSDWENGHFLHGQALTIDGVTFFGLGREIPNGNDAAWNEGMSETESAHLLKNCPKNCVLVTHTPPFECADIQKDGTPGGSVSIRHTIEQQKPILHLCGHIHFSWGAKGIVGKTPVHNLGPTLNWFEV